MPTNSSPWPPSTSIRLTAKPNCGAGCWPWKSPCAATAWPPTPGGLTNAGLAALREADGKLLFAHSDLSGYSVFEEAVWWATGPRGWPADKTIGRQSMTVSPHFPARLLPGCADGCRVIRSSSH